jgi:3-hydroxyisobutyrate dehydrogenase-like beta-hydroxyacid dehydrogenase
LMIGGETRAIERVRPLFAAYAERIRHVGELGHGQMLKLLNNLLFAANLQNAVEIARIAAKQGFSMEDCARVIQECSGASYANGLLQGPAPAESVLGRARPYLAKDLATVLANAAEAGIDLSAFTSTAHYFQSS